MKHTLLIVLGLMVSLLVGAQPSNLVIFSANNEPFTVILDGFRANDLPTGNLKITGMGMKQYDVKVQFNNPSLGVVGKPVMVQPGRELTLALVRQQNGMMDLIFVNEFALNVGFTPPMSQMVVSYAGSPSTIGNPPPIYGNPTPTPTPVPVPMPTPVPTPVPVPVPAPAPPNPLPGYTGPIGCDWPMDANEFQNARRSISEKSFSSSRMTLAKQVTGNNCLLVSQVREIMDLFTFEADKLEYAKFAHAHTYDLANYYRVNDGFTFSSSIDELAKFLEGR